MVLKKRNMLVYSIIENTKYMAHLNRNNAEELRDTKEKLEMTQKFNDKLQE